MYLAFCSLLIACCVTHCIVQIINEQSVQECDATMLNTYSTVWVKKISSFTFAHHSVLKLLTGFATAAFIAWKLTVNNVIATAATITNAKTPKPIFIL